MTTKALTSAMMALTLSPAVAGTVPTFEDGAALTIAGMGLEAQPLVASVTPAITQASATGPLVLSALFVAILLISYRARLRER